MLSLPQGPPRSKGNEINNFHFIVVHSHIIYLDTHLYRVYECVSKPFYTLGTFMWFFTAVYSSMSA